MKDAMRWKIWLGPAVAVALGACASNTDVAVENDNAPGAIQSDVSRDEVLPILNDVRAQARTCGNQAMPAAGLLTWNNRLTAAADGHSLHMRNTETISHSGPNNNSAGDRATAQGYVWARTGENIAAGYATVNGVIDGWLESTVHCQLLMDPGFRDVGVSQVLGGSGNTYSDYWTMVLGVPR